MLPQASALLACAGFVAGWGGWHRGSGTLLQPSDDLGSTAPSFHSIGKPQHFICQTTHASPIFS